MKRSKRLFVMLAALMLGVSGCGKTEHTHTFSTEWSKDATYHWHAATCEHKDEVSEKAAHTWDQGIVVRQANCQVKELKEFTCTVCGEKKQVEGQLGDHIWSTTYEKDATQHWHKCTVQGCNEISEKADHSYGNGEITKDPTYTEEGTYTETCVCGATKDTVVPKLEQAVKPTALTNKDDYALETFGDPQNKVLDYSISDVAYVSGISSYARKLEYTGSSDNYMNLPDNYLSDGLFYLDFDYYAEKAGDGFFYFEVWCNDTRGDCVETKINDLTVGVKKSIRIDVSFIGKTVTKAFIKIHSYQATGEYKYYIDNVKLTKRGVASIEPLVKDSVDGGTFGYKYNSVFEKEVYNLVTKGGKNYEGVYLRPVEAKAAGEYTLKFDYVINDIETNGVYVKVHITGGIALEEPLPSLETGVKKTASYSFAAGADISFIQIFGLNAGVLDLSIANISLSVYQAAEPATKPEALVNLSDYALETFGDPKNKVLVNRNDSLIVKDETYGYVYDLNVGVSGDETYINFDKPYAATGHYVLEFDYTFKTVGSGYFYVGFWWEAPGDPDPISGRVESGKIQDTSAGMHHFVLDIDFSAAPATTTKNFLKFHSWEATESAEVLFDNFKLSKGESITCQDAAGGQMSFGYNAVLGQNATTIISNGLVNYEPFYFKPYNGVSFAAGNYTVTFDYMFASFASNEMFITAFEVNNVNVKEQSGFNVELNVKHTYTMDFELSNPFQMFRIMTGGIAGVVNMSICNIKIVARA